MSIDLKNIFSFLQKNADARPTKVVGIDFGSSSIKVVEVELRENVLALSTYGELQIGPYADTDMGNVVKLPLPKRVEAVVDILRESGIVAKTGVMALPLIDSFVTIVSLPVKDGENIESRVPVEARKYIPVPLTDVTLEWTDVTDAQEDRTSERDILIAAIHNDALIDTRSLLNSIQMVSQPAEIEIFSTLRGLAKESDDALAVIDLGAQMSKLYVSEGGFLRRIHRVRAGGAQVTEAMSQYLSIPFQEAENRKRNYTPEAVAASDIKKITAQTFDRALLEFRRVVSQYEQKSGKKISRIVFTGGSTLFYDFVSYASYMFDQQIELGNPFTKVGYPAFMEDKLREIGPVFAPALGAALRPFEQ